MNRQQQGRTSKLSKTQQRINSSSLSLSSKQPSISSSTQVQKSSQPEEEKEVYFFL